MLMTAAFNKLLLGLLEKMIGMKVLPNSFLRSGRKNVSRRNVSINGSFTNQSSWNVKKVLVSNVGDNVNKKAIVYTNTASCFEHLCSDVKAWMEMNGEMKGDALVIQGDLQP